MEAVRKKRYFALKKDLLCYYNTENVRSRKAKYDMLFCNTKSYKAKFHVARGCDLVVKILNGRIRVI